ncbi:Hypothetical protein CINCED_3A019166 [Cinara cedri]|uniref:Uncharacterized protein n=1 Tax=Cinara cedri TaxID=506608 RepID=A0A5E4M8W1_9HEMI|nr:Hypothetical protein CINCED_3A019166 [Cinara cedri]
MICAKLNMKFLKVSRVLDVRWVTSNYTAIQGIQKTFSVLSNQLYNASKDLINDKNTIQVYRDLYKKLASL